MDTKKARSIAMNALTLEMLIDVINLAISERKSSDDVGDVRLQLTSFSRHACDGRLHATCVSLWKLMLGPVPTSKREREQLASSKKRAASKEIGEGSGIPHAIAKALDSWARSGDPFSASSQ
jgi:hypothetical protein